MTGAANSKTVGFVGLGQMGWPMAANLVAGGVDVVVFDVKPATASDFAQHSGARVMASLAQMGGEAESVILMLPNGDIVREAVLGTDSVEGLVATLAAGSTLIDMSSSQPGDTQALGEEVAGFGLTLVDAPVSGGVKKATSAQLAIMVGGEPAAVESVQWLLQLMGEKIVHAGPLGAGHAMKALNNYVSAAGLVAASDAVRIARSFGIDGATVVDLLNASTGRNNSTENKFHQFILSESYASGFALALMAKDLRIAQSMARQTAHSAPLLECCAELWGQASAETEAAVDHTD